jgi:hypothetical protein
MGNARTSNKDILEAIASQTDAINALVSAISGTVAQPTAQAPAGWDKAETSTPVVTENQTAKPKVPKQYADHMVAKVQDKANSTGESYALYARKNLHGETKLAYCLQSRLATLKDRGYLGVIKLVDPS